MDKWMIAVAAGASSIAQHFKKFKQAGEQITSESSVHGSFSDKPKSPKQPCDKKWPFRRLSRRERMKQDEVSQGVHGEKVASASEFVEEKYEGSDGLLEDVERGDLVNEFSTLRSRMCFGSRKTDRRKVRLLSSLESCVAAHVEVKEYPSSSFASPSMQTLRPFFVTDGNKVINRVSLDSYVAQNGHAVKKQQDYTEEKSRSLDATLLVCLGMSFGILYSFMENKREVERLNRLLKQKENLVQDLEEEIEMKDSLIMQELTLDDHKSRILDGGSFYGESPRSVSRDKDSVIMQEKHNFFSQIEAELEAQLEMLELSMTSSNLERKISNLAELDPDFERGVAEGELRGELLDNANEEDERGSTTTTHSANYAVSPRELSLRLHEVLQSQLEERIRELEAQIKIHNHKSWKDFSSSNAGDENYEDEPVVLNLSGEALEAYNEACNEFAKFDESDEDFDCYDDDNGTPQKGGGVGGGEQDLDDDEIEKRLIKHIVEKARRGSPAVLNAQRAFLSE